MKKGTLLQMPMKSRDIQEYFESLYSNKLENLEETDKLPYVLNKPKLNQEDINHLYRPTTSNEIEAVINSLPTRRAQDLMDSCSNFTKPLKKN
jgi:hypothetical protein